MIQSRGGSNGSEKPVFVGSISFSSSGTLTFMVKILATYPYGVDEEIQDQGRRINVILDLVVVGM